MKRRVAILISGRGSNMAALIEAAQGRDFPAEIVVVISNRADAGGLAKAKASGIPTRHHRKQAVRKRSRRVRSGAAVGARSAQSRSDLPGRLHAAVHGRIRAALVRPDAQHSSLAAAVVSRPRSPWPGAEGRREDFGRHRAFRDSGNRCGSDRDAGRGRGRR